MAYRGSRSAKQPAAINFLGWSRRAPACSPSSALFLQTLLLLLLLEGHRRLERPRLSLDCCTGPQQARRVISVLAFTRAIIRPSGSLKRACPAKRLCTRTTAYHWPEAREHTMQSSIDWSSTCSPITLLPLLMRPLCSPQRPSTPAAASTSALVSGGAPLRHARNGGLAECKHSLPVRSHHVL